MSGLPATAPKASDPVRGRADLALAGVALAWGASFVVIKDALAVMPPHTLLLLRFAVATVALAALFPRAVSAVSARALATGVMLGALLWASFALQTVGLVFTTPAKSAFLTALYVLLVPLLNRALFGARFTRPVRIGIALAFAGLTLLAHPEDLSRVNRGDVLTVGCALAFALHIVLLGRAAPALPAPALALIQLAVVCALSLVAALAWESPSLVLPPRAWAAVLFLGLACSAFAFLVQTWAQRHTAPSRVALLFSLESVFAALLSVALLGERLTPGEWAGGCLVVAGVLVAELAPSWGRAQARTGSRSGPRART